MAVYREFVYIVWRGRFATQARPGPGTSPGWDHGPRTMAPDRGPGTMGPGPWARDRAKAKELGPGTRTKAEPAQAKKHDSAMEMKDFDSKNTTAQ